MSPCVALYVRCIVFHVLFKPLLSFFSKKNTHYLFAFSFNLHTFIASQKKYSLTQKGNLHSLFPFPPFSPFFSPSLLFPLPTHATTIHHKMPPQTCTRYHAHFSPFPYRFGSLPVFSQSTSEMGRKKTRERCAGGKIL